MNTLASRALATATKSGFYDKPEDPFKAHMLIVTEVVEATECVRRCEPPLWVEGGEPGHIVEIESNVQLAVENEAGLLTEPPYCLKPEGEASELVDVMIRVAGYFAHRGWDLDSLVRAKLAYNQTRPYRHGNKAA